MTECYLCRKGPDPQGQDYHEECNAEYYRRLGSLCVKCGRSVSSGAMCDGCGPESPYTGYPGV